MKEEEKIFAGQFFCPGHPDLKAIKLRCHNLCSAYNATLEDETEKRNAIEHQIFGACRRGGFEFLDMQNAVFNRPARDRACASGTAKLAQPHVEASLPVCQPFLRPQWHSETTAFRDGLCRNECVFQIAIAPGPSKPDISGAERIAQMEQHRDLP